MNNLNDITTEVVNSSYDKPSVPADLSLDKLKDYVKSCSTLDEYNAFIDGTVKVKNIKQLDIVKCLFDLICNDVNEINSKHLGDDKTFFNTNKKILLTTLQYTHETLKTYNIDDKKILYHILGTVIQYIYGQNKV
tara:strand:+ start:1033 stop:1437 length:405 start_codon:yes stop_codon:yes gene_type:complete